MPCYPRWGKLSGLLARVGQTHAAKPCRDPLERGADNGGVEIVIHQIGLDGAATPAVRIGGEPGVTFDEGQAFHDAVFPHLEALAMAIENHSENMSLLRLHLGVLPLFGSQRLFPHLAELRERHPLLHIDIDTGISEPMR